MKPNEVRKLIGKRVEWEYAHDYNRGTYFVRTGVITEVVGRNVAIESGGMNDWLTISKMHNLREIKD